MSRFFTAAMLIAGALPGQLVADGALPRSGQRQPWRELPGTTTLEVSDDGTAQLDGRPVTFAQLPARLGGGGRERPLLLRLDATLPAAVLGEILGLLQAREVGRDRIWLAVHGGAAVPFRLLRDGGSPTELYASFDGSPTPDELDDRLRRSAQEADAALLLDAAADMRYQQVLDMLQRPLAAGYERLGVRVTRTTTQRIRLARDPRFARLVAAHPAYPGQPTLSFERPTRHPRPSPPRIATALGERALLYAIGPRAPIAARTRKLIDPALAWLAREQNTDGCWDTSEPVLLTALVAMAFVADGNTLRVGPYSNHLKSAAAWLRRRQAIGTASLPPATDLRTCSVFAAAMTEMQVASDSRLLLPTAQGALIDVEERLLGAHGATDDDVALAFVSMAARIADRCGLDIADDAIARVRQRAARPRANPHAAAIVARMLRDRTAPKSADRVAAEHAPLAATDDPFARLLAGHAAAIAGEQPWRQWQRTTLAEIERVLTQPGALPQGTHDPVLTTACAIVALLAQHRLGH